MEKNWLDRLRAWLRTKLWRNTDTYTQPRRTLTNRRKTDLMNREDEGAFFYLRDVLDQLDMCQKMLRKLRTFDADAYQYHRHAGAKVVPSKAGIRVDHLWSHFLEKRPGRGMALVFAEKDSDYFPSLLYFNKLKQPIPKVQSCPYDTYEVGDIFFVKNQAYGIHWHIAVKDDGSGILLRRKEKRTQQVGHRTIVREDWDWPEAMKFWYQERHKDLKNYSLEEYAFFRFCIVANWCSMPAGDELLVQCRKNGVTASLNVSTKRTPYFFRDRETTVAKDGRRKRIFHIVREHTRELSDGRISRVREHYRGERQFQWNGYDVTIALPRWQGAMEAPLSAHVFDEEDTLEPGYLTAEDLGKAISDIATRGRWRH